MTSSATMASMAMSGPLPEEPPLEPDDGAGASSWSPPPSAWSGDRFSSPPSSGAAVDAPSVDAPAADAEAGGAAAWGAGCDASWDVACGVVDGWSPVRWERSRSGYFSRILRRGAE